MHVRSKRKTLAAFQWSGVALACATLAACGSSDRVHNELPSGVTELSTTQYPATAVSTGATAAQQDLLTGGIGKTGLGGAAPAYADPANPTVAELRRNALFSNYRGILDPLAAGGYGSLYGPNVTAAGVVTQGEGLIPGREYIAVLDDGIDTDHEEARFISVNSRSALFQIRNAFRTSS